MRAVPLSTPVARRCTPSTSAKTPSCVRPVVSTRAGSSEMMMWESLRQGLDEEMERDPRVMMMGEDVGHYGGSYKVSYDLYKKYGDMRLLDTPICENGFMGMGVGAAMTGLRPIVEGMNMGFLLLAFNQISNNCGMLHYTSGGQYSVPMVIRGPGGRGPSAWGGAFAAPGVVLPVDSWCAACGGVHAEERQGVVEGGDPIGQSDHFLRARASLQY